MTDSTSEAADAGQPPDPLVKEHQQKQAAAAEWHRRVAEWRTTVDAPLDALLPRWQAAWDGLAAALTPPAAAARVSTALRAVAAAFRDLETIRAAGAAWYQGGQFGSLDVSVARLDWSRSGPLAGRCDVTSVPGPPPPDPLRVTGRLVHLGLTADDARLAAQVEPLLGLSGAADAAAWAPVIGACLTPLPGWHTLNDAGDVAGQACRAAAAAFPVPPPTAQVPARETALGVSFAILHIGQMGTGYDWLRAAVWDRLGLGTRPNGPAAGAGDRILVGRGDPIPPAPCIHGVADAALERGLDPATGPPSRSRVSAPPGGVSPGTLAVYTGRPLDDRFAQVSVIAADSTRTVGERLQRIDEVLRIPATASAAVLAGWLGVSKPSILKTQWWQDHRRGLKDEEIQTRVDRLRERGDRQEPHERRTSGDDDG